MRLNRRSVAGCAARLDEGERGGTDLVKGISAFVAIGVALGGLAAPAPGRPPAREKWVAVGHNKGTRSFVDRRSYDRSGDLVRFDGRINLRKPDHAGVSVIRHRSEVDCVGRTMRLVSFSGHRRGGSVVTGYSFGAGGASSAVAPGSNGAKTLDFVCSDRRKQVR